MKKLKKVISFFMLMIIFLSSAQNIVFGATTISKADLKKGDSITTNVKFDNGEVCYEVEAHYIYYKDKSHPAYCISHRIRWSRRKRKLYSRC